MRPLLPIGVDTGGTFTDCLCLMDGRLHAFKLLSTPDDPARAVLDGVRGVVAAARSRDAALPAIPEDAAHAVRHGSTVATNALLERAGGPIALVCTEGFRDLLRIGRQHRPRLYDLRHQPEPPLAPPTHCLEIPGRVDRHGRVILPLDEAVLAALPERIRALDVAAVAVCLLFSFVNPEHELRVAEALGPLRLPVSLSHQIHAEFREYERAAVTAVNAYVAPRMGGYLGRIEEGLRPGDSLRIMQSNGGAISAATARREPARTILSGPAGGVVAALATGRRAGLPRLMTFDMGGTSTDVSLLDGELSLTTRAQAAGLPVCLPMIDIHAVGAGGGSIARLDAGGALRVGPTSAGADPGPVCHGRGEAITVTDCNCFLGRLPADHFLGGTMRLDRERVRPRLERLAAAAGLSPEAMAEGVLAVADAAMERALRVISVERGHDPREFALCCYGGAGGLHAASLARALGMDRVLVPANPGLFSALGMLLADVVTDYSRTVMRSLPESGAPDAPGGPTEDVAAEQVAELVAELVADLAGTFAPLLAQAREDLHREAPGAPMVLSPGLDMRYAGQSFDLTVPAPEGLLSPDGGVAAPALLRELAASFHAVHARAHGQAFPGKPVEIVTLRLRAVALLPEQVLPALPLAGPTPPEAARLDRRPVWLDGAVVETALWQRERLLPGNVLPGPAIVVEYSSTTLVPRDFQARVDVAGNLLLERRA